MADSKLTYQILIQMQNQASGVAKVIEKDLNRVQQSAQEVVSGVGKIGRQLSVISNASVNSVKNTASFVNSLRKQYHTLGQDATSVSNTLNKGVTASVPKFNMLNMSVQQVTRELTAPTRG